MKISANLGFLWTELGLPNAIKAAALAGFDAVECHWPYETPPAKILEALKETGLNMLGINTVRGDVSAGDNGLAAIPGREAEARQAIDQALRYAFAIGTPNVHVMAGQASGEQARHCFIDNLRYATAIAATRGRRILIEPLNHHDAPGYFLQYSDQARDIIEEVGAGNLKLMFDCYHLQIMEGDITRRLRSLMPLIGHVQIAAVPSRSEPDGGELDYRHVLGVLRDAGYEGAIGAEYKPAASTEAGLEWLNEFKKICKQ